MNTVQRDRAKAVIAGAALLCGEALIADGFARFASPRGFVCCAMGELALAAGHTPDDLRAMAGASPEDYPDLLPGLVTTFGLSRRQSDAIVGANDDPFSIVDALPFLVGVDADDDPDYDFPSARKAAVLAKLDSFAVAEDIT